MTYTQADLDMADRHIAQGERHVVNQERIISELSAHDQSTELAEQLLEEFRETLRQHRLHRDRIAEDLHAGDRF
jgi:hypothetical protein